MARRKKETNFCERVLFLWMKKTYRSPMMWQPFLPNVPLSLIETINILVDKAFTNDCFNLTFDLNLEKEELTKLLAVATTNQLFQFDGQLFDQTDGVAMGLPRGPLMANVFMC